MKTAPIFLTSLLFTGLLLAGCTDVSKQVTGQADRDALASKQNACSQQLNTCQTDCDNKGYLLASDIEACKNRCSNDYNTCLG